MKKILLIDFSNFYDYPMGGVLTFSKHLIAAFDEDKIFLIGITTEKQDPIGQWFKKNINGKIYEYFALARINKKTTKHIIPDRLTCFFLIKYYKKKLLANYFQNVIIQRQEILPAIKDFGYENICYLFPGVTNPMNISKYSFGIYFSKIFDKLFFHSFKNVRTILASADDEAIIAMVERSKGKLNIKSIMKFPTRIDTQVFKIVNKAEARKILNIPISKTVVITTGRLTKLKGWKLMIDSFYIFQKSVPDSLFYIVGDGEDFQKIEEYALVKELTEKIILTGNKTSADIALYLNAGNLFVMGSFKEGWPTSLVEAVACGIPACVTKFSAASDIISEGVNGFIEVTRNPVKFSVQMFKTLSLGIINADVSKYSIDSLKEDLLNLWPLK